MPNVYNSLAHGATLLINGERAHVEAVHMLLDGSTKFRMWKGSLRVSMTSAELVEEQVKGALVVTSGGLSPALHTPESPSVIFHLIRAGGTASYRGRTLTFDRIRRSPSSPSFLAFVDKADSKFRPLSMDPVAFIRCQLLGMRVLSGGIHPIHPEEAPALARFRVDSEKKAALRDAYSPPISNPFADPKQTRYLPHQPDAQSEMLAADDVPDSPPALSAPCPSSPRHWTMQDSGFQVRMGTINYLKVN